MELITASLPYFIAALLLGVFTKIGDIAYDDGFKLSETSKILLGVAWGTLGGFIVIYNHDIAAFYLGILLSWIMRYKLDNYSHGIGAAIIIFMIVLAQPVSSLQIAVAITTFVLFTLFGLLSRYKILQKGFFIEYNIYSFIFLGVVAVMFPQIWIVVLASLGNVIGYHIIKKWWYWMKQHGHNEFGVGGKEVFKEGE